MDSFFFPDAQQLPSARWASLPFQRLKIPLPEEHSHVPPGKQGVSRFHPHMQAHPVRSAPARELGPVRRLGHETAFIALSSEFPAHWLIGTAPPLPLNLSKRPARPVGGRHARLLSLVCLLPAFFQWSRPGGYKTSVVAHL